MILYCHTESPRLHYITDFIGNAAGIGHIRITTSIPEFQQYDGPKINYSTAHDHAGFYIKPQGILFESDIKSQHIECFAIDGFKAFFRSGGPLNFDIFAASFYLLSRYEEYLPHEKDGYGRYAHTNSLAFKEQFLHLPLINIWLRYFVKKLQEYFQGLAVTPSTFRYLPTYDIDEAFSYKYKSWWRIWGGVARDFMSGRLDLIRERLSVLNGKQNDPYDAHGWMDALHQQYELEPLYFFLVAQQTGRYDKNNLPQVTAMQELVRQHAGKYDIGLHPSWQSGDDISLLGKEKKILEQMSGRDITRSRQHYLRFTLPATYRALLEAGIKEDYSMGYGTINGFRASVAFPFYWYDLGREQQTGLLLYPFCYMDANSFYELKQSAGEALEEMRGYYEVVKETGGVMITLWHNTFLGTDVAKKGWRETYVRFLDMVRQSSSDQN